MNKFLSLANSDRSFFSICEIDALPGYGLRKVFARKNGIELPIINIAREDIGVSIIVGDLNNQQKIVGDQESMTMRHMFSLCGIGEYTMPLLNAYAKHVSSQTYVGKVWDIIEHNKERVIIGIR